MNIQTEPQTLELACFVGKVPVTIGESFVWDGLHAGTYKVLGWSGRVGMYSPAGIGGTIGVMVEDDQGNQVEWCGDSVAHGIYMTKNPDHFKKK